MFAHFFPKLGGDSDKILNDAIRDLEDNAKKAVEDESIRYRYHV